MEVIETSMLAGREGGSWVVQAGETIRITDVEGGPIGDFVCFNANDLGERLSQARTKANQGKFLISTGDRLYSRENNVLMTIIEDTYGIHDLQYGMCSAWVFEHFEDENYDGFSPEQMGVGGPLGVPSFGCYEVLQRALRGWGLSPRDIPDPLNLFQTMAYDLESGSFVLVDGRSRPGDHVELRAEMDCLCALSACPSMGRSLKVDILRP